MKRNLKRVILLFLLATTTCLLSNCKKDDAAGMPGGQRQVKYEITGNFSGKLTIIYSDNVNGNTVLNNIAVPWSKEIFYPATVTVIGIGAQANVMGVAGQSASLKIYVGGTMVKSANATAGVSGEIALPTLGHTL